MAEYVPYITVTLLPHLMGLALIYSSNMIILFTTQLAIYKVCIWGEHYA